jgi:hypothetical protein
LKDGGKKGWISWRLSNTAGCCSPTLTNLINVVETRECKVSLSTLGRRKPCKIISIRDRRKDNRNTQ